MSNQKEPVSEAFNIKEFILTALPYKYYYHGQYFYMRGCSFYD